MKNKASLGWPIIKHYDADHLDRIALPLGGIGTGTVSLGGRGDLRDWEIMNRPGKGFNPGPLTAGVGGYFAVLRCKAAGKNSAPIVRCVEGPLSEILYEGQTGAKVVNHCLPRFRNCTFDAAYPLGMVNLSDPDVPVSVRLEAFNPLIPGNADDSGLPVAVLRYVLRNRTNKPVEISLCATLQNYIGADGANWSAVGWDTHPDHTRLMKNNFNETRDHQNTRGLCLQSEGLDRRDPTWGTMAIAALDTPADAITRRTSWAERSWGDSLLEFWDDFSDDGKLIDHPRGNIKDPRASLAVSAKIPAGGERAITIVLSWHFPNRLVWYPRTLAQIEEEKKKQEEAASSQGTTPVTIEQSSSSTGADSGCGCGPEGCGPSSNLHPDYVGNYYTNAFRDAWDVIERTAPRLKELERQTVAFVRAVAQSDLPVAVTDAAMSTLTGLRSQTTFRTADGLLYGWEGCFDTRGCCEGSCTHVWNYENSVGFLFGDLSRAMRRVEFVHATNEKGVMSFRVHLPLDKHAQNFKHAAADGQMGTIVRAYRDWKLSGDENFLREIWPGLKRSLEFCWIDKGWDADRDGVMEGCQHNTMDVEYFGPNPQMTVWYIAALRGAAKMAQHLGESDFARTCDDMATRGSKWIDEHLFNGEYYEHKIVSPGSWDNVAPELKMSMGTGQLDDPDLQIGAGCLIDQLVGQTQAHVCGLGHVIDPKKSRATMSAIFKHNFKSPMWGHFNHFRTYALQEESALIMCSYPRGRRPKRPFPYYNEVMTGFEHIAAAGMLYEGLTKEGLTCIEAIRDRYDGRKRSPFNEAECGHHYARAMASWTAILALSGFQYDATQRTMQFAASNKPVTWFWSNGSAWGTFEQKKAPRGCTIKLTVLHGQVTLNALSVAGVGTKNWPAGRTIAAGQTVTESVTQAPRANRTGQMKRRTRKTK